MQPEYKRCIIISFYGDNTAWRHGAFAVSPQDYVICADSGYTLARILGIRPHLVVGDFDSISEKEIPPSVPVKRFPTEKSQTDTQLAVEEGLAMGLRDFVILGGLGGRVDHTLANIALLKYLSRKHATARIVSSNTEILFLSGSAHVNLQNCRQATVSLVAYSERVDGVHTYGMKYTPPEEVLKNDSSLGISNIVLEDTAKIEISSGDLLVIINK